MFGTPCVVAARAKQERGEGGAKTMTFAVRRRARMKAARFCSNNRIPRGHNQIWTHNPPLPRSFSTAFAGGCAPAT
jgi:hypothetical protein